MIVTGNFDFVMFSKWDPKVWSHLAAYDLN